MDNLLTEKEIEDFGFVKDSETECVIFYTKEGKTFPHYFMLYFSKVESSETGEISPMLIMQSYCPIRDARFLLKTKSIDKITLEKILGNINSFLWS